MRNVVLDQEGFHALVSDLVNLGLQPIKDDKIELARVAVVTLILHRAGFTQADITQFVKEARELPINLASEDWTKGIIGRVREAGLKLEP